ncbi:MAG: hypothetical protein AAF430_18390 [Myxococcota bacterium]
MKRERLHVAGEARLELLEEFDGVISVDAEFIGERAPGPNVLARDTDGVRDEPGNGINGGFGRFLHAA